MCHVIHFLFFYLVVALVGSPPIALGQQGCQLDLHLEPGSGGYLKSPRYPQAYPPGIVCRWRLSTAQTSSILIRCQEFDVPSDGSFCRDRFVLSPVGDDGTSKVYCGRREFTERSKGSRLEALLVSDRWSRGGGFYCRVFAEPSRPQPPPGRECDCGWSYKTRIVGGVEAKINEFPMMVGLVSVVLGRIACGATIVSPWYVLTAAHCLRSVTPEQTGLLVGDHDTSTGRDTNSTRLIRASNFVVHPGYDVKTSKNDLALVRGREPIGFNSRVGPACLPFNDVYPESVMAVGWGTLEFGGEAPTALRKVNLDVVDMQDCLQTYGSDKVVRQNQLCTYSPGRDACQFDSGGPLLWRDPESGRLFIAGVISYGRGCAEPNTPSVNTRVSSYMKWIIDSTKGEEFCVK